jgi:hypothetical protein
MTTAQTSTTLGSSGQNGSGVDVWSDVVIPLGAVLVGALASLAGSVLVNRWQLRKNTRLEVWEDILPAITGPWARYELHVNLGTNLPSKPPIQAQLSTLRRKVVLLKRRDKEACDALNMAWNQWNVVRMRFEPTRLMEGVEEPPEVDYEPLQEAEQNFHKKLWDYYYYVEKQLQPFHWRVVSLFSRLFRRRKRRVATAARS